MTEKRDSEAESPERWSRDVLRRFREGDLSLLEVIFKEHNVVIARLARARLRRGSGETSEFDVDTAVLDTFERAFEPRARLSYDGIRPFRAFLLGIARNVLLERLRGDELARARFDAVAVEAVDPEPGPEARLADAQLEALLRRFATMLNNQDRALFETRFDEGLSQEDAAAALGLSRGKLRRREERLRVRLLAHLEAHGYFDPER